MTTTIQENVRRFHQELADIKARENMPTLYTDWDDDTADYDCHRRLFNRRFDHKPAAVLMCKSSAHVQAAIQLAKDYELDLRVKSGGHDHEGESSATDCILINFSEMMGIEFGELEVIGQPEKLKVVHVQPGWIFREIVKELDARKISVPHGTCGTVGLAGFALGGGWGPWTRLHGMCCDRLAGATVILGNGEEVKLSINDTEPAKKELLWALRGGGGFSYGVVTEFVINYFDQPEETRKFRVVFNESPALQVLERWEQLIDYDQNEHLLGTNLQIMGVPMGENVAVEDSIQPCTFYGYLAGDSQAVKDAVVGWFADFKSFELVIEEYEILETCHYRNQQLVDCEIEPRAEAGAYSFGNWHRVSQASITPVPMLGTAMPTLIPPDSDESAPHRITSKVVQEGGFDEEGRKVLINSMRSNLITKEAYEAGIFQYVTLGAISGSYYQRYKDNPSLAYESAFPYHLRPYFVQYQVWWNTEEKYREVGVLHHVRQLANRAMDWIDVSRERSFPQTEGSFISFKDASVPTQNYFLHNYDRLVNIKKQYVNDPDNLFRSRKTIT